MAPKATIMRTEDDATAAAAYVSGQAELFATNSLIIPDLQKRNPSKEFDLKFTIRRSPAHMGVRMGEHNLLQWLEQLHLLQHDERRDRPAAPEVARHEAAAAADTVSACIKHTSP